MDSPLMLRVTRTLAIVLMLIGAMICTFASREAFMVARQTPFPLVIGAGFGALLLGVIALDMAYISFKRIYDWAAGRLDD